jgi:D-alanine-D-alanine ligase
MPTATESVSSDQDMQAPRVRPLTITVLAGGPGPEREVSLQSGKAVYDALCRLGHRTTRCDVNPDDLSALDRTADVVFIALHGEFGEDGSLQAELDARGIPYCGSGPAASRLAMDKAATKERLVRNNLPTPPYEVVEPGGAAGLAARFPTPAVVKPVASGSSVDTTIARTPEVLEDATARLLNRYGRSLVERYIAGPELTVGILDDTALPVCEIRTRREFYDYEAKYIDDDTEYRFDVDLPAPLLKRVEALSVATHRVLGCRVFSRVDWMVDAATLEPYILEVNTIPGFTSHSLLPKAAARIGIGFDELCQRIVDRSMAQADGAQHGPA